MLSERHRAHLYQHLSTVADEEAVAEMLTNFPSRPDQAPATKSDLAMTSSELRTELKTEMADLRTDMATLKADLTRTILISQTTLVSVVSLVFTLLLVFLR